MRQAFISFMIVVLFAGAAGAECVIVNQEKIHVGSYAGMKGRCSNNDLPITCIMMEGTGIECDGPGGGFTGYNLETLIFAACGCSAQKENELQQKRRLDPK